MKILVASNNDSISDYLQEQGLSVNNLYSNDLAISAIEGYEANVVVYFSAVHEVIPHYKCLAQMKEKGVRIILATDDLDMMSYAATLGITDILIPPLGPEDVLYLLNNPATQEQVAEMILKYKQSKEPVTEQQEPCKKQNEQKNEQKEQSEQKEDEKPKGVKRRRKGQPAVIICVGDRRIEEWITKTYAEQLEILLVTSDIEEAKAKTTEVYPDILILMSTHSLGGVADAEKVAAWAVDKVPAVLYILGQLDEVGIEREKIALEAGVQHILTCEKGGFISGNELVFKLENIISEINQMDECTDIVKDGVDIKTSLGALTKGVGSIGKAFFKASDDDPGTESIKKKKERPKKVKPKINKKEGLSLSEEDELPIMSNIKNPTSIVPGGILAIVTPWRPSLAGRLAAQAVRILSEVENSEVAYIGASKDSTGGIWLDLSTEELMMSDWRVPGSNAPIRSDNKIIYATDPSKDLPLHGGDLGLPEILRDSRKTATYTVMDFAGDMSAVTQVAHQGRVVILVVLPAEDPVELQTSSLWLRLFMEGKQNIVVGMDVRGRPGNAQCEFEPKLIIQGNPADAMATALRQVGEDEFVWS